jgi:hypothetical protein
MTELKEERLKIRMPNIKPSFEFRNFLNPFVQRIFLPICAQLHSQAPKILILEIKKS